MARHARGSMAWGLCQQCGLRGLLNDLVFDGQVPYLRVCVDCWDPKHPQERLAPVSDPMALWRPSPEMGGPTAPVLSASDVVSGLLDWTIATVGDSIIEAYRVVREQDEDAVVLISLPVTRDEFGAITAQTLTYLDLDLPAGTATYWVEAVDAMSRSTRSNPVTVVG